MNTTARIRMFLLVALDFILVNTALIVALLLRFDGAHIPQAYIHALTYMGPLSAVVVIFMLNCFKLYNRVWEYASIKEMIAIFKAVFISFAIVWFLDLYTPLPDLPRSVLLITAGLVFLLISSSRVYWRVLRDELPHFKKPAVKKCLIIGAGDAGVMGAREIQQNSQLGLTVTGFIDDDPGKQGRILYGIPVLGTREDILRLVKRQNAEEIIIAMPSASGRTIREIARLAKQTPARVRILPGIYDSARGLMASLRDIRMEDLLGREAVKTDLNEITAYLKEKTVMITGAGGSIGSEMCRQIINFAPSRLIIVDNCENNLFDIQQELLHRELGAIRLCTVLLDVKNRGKLQAVFKKYQPQVIFHAAAYKHVPMMEVHPDEALANNVFGTKNIAEMADKYGCETFILISTDKAVNPSSIMGATKRIAELVVKDLNRGSKTRFAAVRFGNVLGSRGSVIPTFIKQIEHGGPVTVTHPDMTRYFMTIPEAVALVFQAGAQAQGGEIFVLDMGEPVKIAELACDLIALAGYEPERDIKIQYTGVRPGEKLYEELFTDREGIQSTKHQRIFISRKQLDEEYEGILSTINLFDQNPVSTRKEVIKLVAKLVPEYRSTSGTVSEEIAATGEG